MTYFITGGCGFVGSNLAATLLGAGKHTVVFDNLSRHGSAQNLDWLKSLGLADFVQGDVRDFAQLDAALERVRPQAILHLSGQVAMTTSINDPRRDFETNVLGSFNLLESARQRCPDAAIVYSSSNKVYGELAGVSLKEEPTRYTAADFPKGIPEQTPLDFQTPYGCSKGAADQYMLDYARVYGLNTVVFRHSTIFGGRQFATFDQGWVGWFCQQAIETQRDPQREPFTIAGDGKQVRDLLFVEDAVACYLAAVENIAKARGQAFNIGGGMENSSSLLELFAFLEEELGIALSYQKLAWRHSDQKYFVADPAKAQRLLNWEPKVSKQEGIRRMLAWVSKAN